MTNADLAAHLDTSDEWIRSRSGIRERRVGSSTGSLATGAGRAALASAGCTAEDIDLLILATTTPDQAVPATSAVVQRAIGLECGALDVNAACSGFVYSLVAAQGMIGLGCRRILLIGAETLSRITDPDDRATAVLFGDGAGAVVLEATDAPTILGWHLGCDGAAQPILYADHGAYIAMDGPEVFHRAIRVTVDGAQSAMARAGVTTDDLALFVPHQANLRIIESAAERLGIPMDRVVVVLDRYGNTSAASIPIALAEAADAGRIRPGDLVLLAGFGAGMTWASVVLRWDVGDRPPAQPPLNGRR